MLTLTPPAPYIVKLRVAAELHCTEAKAKNDKVASGNEPAAACSYKGEVRKFAMVNSSRY
jgi:hypothetical protein